MNTKIIFLGFFFVFLHVTKMASQSPISLIDSTYVYLENTYYEHKHIDSVKAKEYAALYLQKAKKEKNLIEIIEGYYFIVYPLNVH